MTTSAPGTNDKSKGILFRLVSIIAVIFSLYHLYTVGFTSFPPMLHRSAHLGLILALVFLTKPTKKGLSIRWYDMLIAAWAVVCCAYFWINYDSIVYRIVWVTPLTILEYVLGISFILIVLEATRRTLGNVLAILCIIFLAYALFGQVLPGNLGHSGFTSVQLIDQIYLTTEGILGSPIGVSANYIALFILFGAFLQRTGAANFFMDLAAAIAGRKTGGPAQVAVLASAFFGSISGAAVANVVTTGQVTIPMMKKIGYRAEFAGAVEAVASTGGQIMPPVMASAAFLMSEYLGISYAAVLKHAIVPALLYFGAVSIMVYIESKKMGIKGLSASEIPDIKKVIAKSGYHILPLVVLVGLLVTGYSAMYAAYYSIITTVVIGFIQRNNRVNIKGLFEALADGGKNVIPVAMACAAAGIIVGIINLTGLGVKFSSLIIVLSANNAFLALVVTAIAVVILGMGLPTAAAYIVCVALIIPALVKLGYLTISAHMFVLYFAILSSITPPVALSSYAAAGLAGADFWKTGLVAMRLGIAAYIVPFMFAYSPILLLVGDISWEWLAALITACLGIWCLAIASMGWWKINLNWLLRIVFLAAAITLIFPGFVTDAIGLVLAGLGFVAIKNFAARAAQEIEL